MLVKYFKLILVYNLNMKTLGENLRELRKLNKISQKQFAEKINTTQQRVSEWERNKIEPSFYNIVKILKLYDITFEELIEDVEI